jgi:hypothetical protein
MASSTAFRPELTHPQYSKSNLQPHVMEMTFYNHKRACPGQYRTDFPHPLDADNCLGLPAMPLPDCWR